MSRRGGNYGGNFRRGRGNGSSSSWTNSHFFKRPKRPPGLRGREIGLFYRDLHNLQIKSTINLRIPKPVITELIRNLELIGNVAKKEGIKINPKKFSILFGHKSRDKVESRPNDTKVCDVIELDDEAEVKCDEIIDLTKQDEESDVVGKQCDKSEACGSLAADFIPLEYKIDSDYGNGNKMLSLRGAGDYKYGYEDIITGTFTEKLEESLSKGINITHSSDDIASLNTVFYEDFKNVTNKSQYKSMMKFRETLPTYKKRKDLLNAINSNQVVVISGETGCGKSTQVPQLILDEAILNKKGANCKIVITQPRRIAASSLAARVASERAESVGNSVGYAVRLEKIEARPRASMMFCTTGVLLVDLELNQGLTEYSHVILDEVHERDCHIDFAMCMLKQILQKRKDLKLILMSATLDADKLSAYFNDCPMMHIEGLAYPVEDVYLEDILTMTGFKLDPAPEMNQRNNKRHNKRFQHGASDMEKAIQYRAEIDAWLRPMRHNLHPSVYNTLQDHRIETLNLDLIFALLTHICRGPPGAVLIFLPGISDITKLISMITGRQSMLASRLQIYALHSKLPSLDQQKIFERPPDSIRKIVVATNIAETSITIDDIVYVVDCGKIKYSGLNIENYTSTLKTEWASQANLRQRRGRAGRCQPGVCYHLVTSYRASKLDERLLPELQRSNLLEPVLTIKRLRLGKAADALQKVPDPPAETTVERAVSHLQQCGALDFKELLTPLGWHLARLPLHPTAGKLVLLGALFGCLDRAVSVAAVWSFKDPFILVIEKDAEVKAVKRDFALGEPSDHVAISEAIIQWERSSRKRDFAYRHFLSNNTLELLSDMKNQIGGNLNQMGFLNSNNVRASWENRNSNNLSLFKAIVAASLYPNIATARWSGSRNPYKQKRVRARIPEGNIQIHPSSLMVPPQRGLVTLCSNPGANWLVYWLKQRSSDLFLIEVTLVYTLPLLFFGELQVSAIEDDPDECYISISNYKIHMLKETAELLLELRNLLDQVLAAKIMVSSTHSTKHSEFEERVLNAVIEVLTAEDERVEYIDDESDSSETN